jgi:hypothetical protein
MPIVVSPAQSYRFRTLPSLIERVLSKLGARGVGESPSAEDTAIVRDAFDLRLKELHELGVLWFNVSGAVTDLALTANVATKSLEDVTDFLFPVTLKLRIGAEDREVEIISHRQYHAITDKTDTGEPDKAFFAPDGTVYFHPVPNSAYTAKLTYQAMADDTTASGEPDIPVSMMRCLVDVIAMDLIDDFEVTGEKAMRLEMKGKEALRIIPTLNSERVDAGPVKAVYF